MKRLLQQTYATPPDTNIRTHTKNFFMFLPPSGGSPRFPQSQTPPLIRKNGGALLLTFIILYKIKKKQTLYP
jgi:hypothetical protein